MLIVFLKQSLYNRGKLHHVYISKKNAKDQKTSFYIIQKYLPLLSVSIWNPLPIVLKNELM